MPVCNLNVVANWWRQQQNYFSLEVVWCFFKLIVKDMACKKSCLFVDPVLCIGPAVTDVFRVCQPTEYNWYGCIYDQLYMSDAISNSSVWVYRRSARNVTSTGKADISENVEERIMFQFLCSSKGEAYSRRFVRPSCYLVRQITLKLLLPFKSNLVYR